MMAEEEEEEEELTQQKQKQQKVLSVLPSDFDFISTVNHMSESQVPSISIVGFFGYCTNPYFVEETITKEKSTNGIQYETQC